ncbi:MAG: hypothetical protein JOZ01_00695 [Candidatus Eremiobacteraeota bacterium]|nr:hypothetical protein [Candidatus Eremiobacteraeota bacterium]
MAGCRGAPGSALPALQSSYTFGSPAGAVRFEPIGPTHMSDGLPTSGKVNAYAVDPRDSKIIYMAGGRGTGLETYSSAGILRTDNGGYSWKRVVNGLDGSSGAVASVVNALWLDPHDPAVLLAATEYDGLFRSSDAGSSWTNVYRTTGATQILGYGHSLFAATAAGILTSDDDGTSWSVQLAGTPKVQPRALGAVEGSKGSALYAGMTDGSIWSFASGRWSNVGKLPYHAHTGTDGSQPDVHQIAVDPLAPATLYASSNDGSWDQDLHASTDGGKTWNTVLAKVYYNDGLGTQAIEFSKVHPHRLFVGSDGWMYYVTGDGSPNPAVHSAANLSVIDVRNIWTVANGSDDACWVASDQGLDYEPTCSASGGRYNDTVVSASSATGLARRFTVAPDGKTLLVSLQDFGSHFTSDGGSTWALDNFLYEDGFNELRPGNPGVCYAYDEASGLSVSTNGCASFKTLQGGIFPSRLMTTPIAFDPRDPLTMYVVSGPNINLGFNGPKGVYKSSDGGATISRLGWSFAWAGAIIVDQRYGPHILVSDLSHGKSSLSVTTAGAATWKTAAGVPPTPFWYAMTISPVDGRTVLASSVDAKNNVFVLRSNDGGRKFARVATVVNAPLVRGRADREHRLQRSAGEELAIDAHQAESARRNAQAFVYSPERAIRYNPSVKKGVPDVVITTLRGAFVSADNGSHWQRLDTNLVAHSFWEIRWLNGYVYLASDGQGILRSTTRLQSGP